MVAPGLLLPDNFPQDTCPLKIPPGNCPRRKLPFGLFVAYIIASLANGPEETAPPPPPAKIVTRINYTRDIFPQESEIVVL